jgi:hypothetical protein
LIIARRLRELRVLGLIVEGPLEHLMESFEGR